MTLPQPILNAVKNNFNISTEQDFLLEPINSGLSLADTYLLGVNEKRYLLRHQKEEATENHWRQQILAIKTLRDSGVIPQMHLINEDLKFYVMEYIENLDFASQLFDQEKAPGVLSDFFNKLKIFHNTKIESNHFVVRDFLDIGKSQYNSYKQNLPEWLILKVERSVEAFEKIPVPEKRQRPASFLSR